MPIMMFISSVVLAHEFCSQYPAYAFWMQLCMEGWNGQ